MSTATLEQFEAKVNETHADNPRYLKEYTVSEAIQKLSGLRLMLTKIVNTYFKQFKTQQAK